MIIAADFCGICGVSVYGSSKGSPFGAIVLTDGRTAPKQGGSAVCRAQRDTHLHIARCAFSYKEGAVKKSEVCHPEEHLCDEGSEKAAVLLLF